MLSLIRFKIVTSPDHKRYQEALANPQVSIRLGRREVKARAEPEHNPLLIRAVSVAYRKKYGERWPDDTQAMLKRSVLPTTLRLTPLLGVGNQ